jgi:hypothetical protein
MGEKEMDEAAAEADKREFAADERDEKALERDRGADVRDEVADERDQISGAREAELDDRERQLDKQAEAIGEPPAHSPADTSLAAMQRENAWKLRDAARLQRDDRSVERRAEDAARENVKKRRKRDD